VYFSVILWENEMKNIIVVEDKKISKQYEKRFVVVDKET